jgi:hypothetical protein
VTRKKRRLLAGFALGFLGAASGAVHFVGKSHAAPTYKAMPVVTAAIEDPATLVPLTLSAPTPERDDLFGKRMMRFGLALDRAGTDPAVRRELPDLEAGLTGADMQAALGPDAAAALRNIVRVAKESASAPPLDQASVTALDMAVARLDNSLLAAKLPYFVDATVMTDLRGNNGRSRRIIVLSEFSIVESNLYSSEEDASVRTVRVRRLDRLNWKHSSLGFVNPHRAQAAVLLDVVDDQVLRHLLPALADDAAMPLIPLDGNRARPEFSPAIAGLAARAGEHARAELGALPGVDRDALRDLGAALHDRQELYDTWNRHRRPPGLGLRAPTMLALDLSSLGRELGDQVEAEDLEALGRIQARLESEAAAKVYTTLRDTFADSIERHEVQHRLDLKHATVVEPLPVPAPVAALIRGESQAADELRDAVKNELSGYVAQLARDHRIPRTTLTLLLRFLVNPRTRTSTEAYVARIAAEELCAVLGIRGVAPLVHDGRLDEDRLARAHRELTSVPPKELTTAAATLWGQLFGRRLPTIARRS